jgi:regulator of protease activity HflC (stomatin/prohibitin superfamily)
MENEEAVNQRQPERETQDRQHQKGNPGGFISTIVFFLSIAFIACFVMWLYTGFVTTYAIWCIFLFFAAICVNNIKIVQAPEIWIIERFGEYNRKLKPGPHWTIPFIETVRARPRINERYIRILDSQEAVMFTDGLVTLKNPRAYVELNEDHVEDAIYKVDNWGKWVNKVLGPIVRGYLNTLSSVEGLDEGGARGDILDKIRTRPEITRIQLDRIKNSIEEVRKKLKKAISKEDKRFFESIRKELEEKQKVKTDRKTNQENLRKELEKFITDAKQRGFKEIHRVGVGEFILSKPLREAREAVKIAQEEAIAAISDAAKEATMRTGPIIESRERFKDIGFSEEDAREKAFMLDMIETLAEKRSLFLTGASKGDLNALAAQATAIFSEVSQRRKEPEKETKISEVSQRRKKPE